MLVHRKLGCRRRGVRTSCRLPFRRTRLGLLVQLDPAAASKELLAVFRSCKGSADDAAERLGVTRRQFDRWVRTLNLVDEVVEIRDRFKGQP